LRQQDAIVQVLSRARAPQRAEIRTAFARIAHFVIGSRIVLGPNVGAGRRESGGRGAVLFGGIVIGGVLAQTVTISRSIIALKDHAHGNLWFGHAIFGRADMSVQGRVATLHELDDWHIELIGLRQHGIPYQEPIVKLLRSLIAAFVTACYGQDRHFAKGSGVVSAVQVRTLSRIALEKWYLPILGTIVNARDFKVVGRFGGGLVGEIVGIGSGISAAAAAAAAAATAAFTATTLHPFATFLRLNRHQGVGKRHGLKGVLIEWRKDFVVVDRRCDTGDFQLGLVVGILDKDEQQDKQDGQ
jgi:hypothetical protein